MRGQMLDVEKVNALYGMGLTVPQIAAEVGCCEDTVTKKLRKTHRQYNQVLPPPPAGRFDLHLGEKFSAYEPEISSVRHIYKVVFIGRYIFVGERVHGYPWKVAFLIKDYGRRSDSGHVKNV